MILSSNLGIEDLPEVQFGLTEEVFAASNSGAMVNKKSVIVSTSNNG